MNDSLDDKIAAAIAAASQPIPAAHRNRSKSRSHSKSGVSASSPKREDSGSVEGEFKADEAMTTSAESSTAESEGGGFVKDATDAFSNLLDFGTGGSDAQGGPVGGKNDSESKEDLAVVEMEKVGSSVGSNSPGRRPRSESSDIVKGMKHSKVQSPSPLKEKHAPISFENLQSERLSFSSTFRHRHVSPTRRPRNTLTDNQTGVDEAKAAEYLAEGRSHSGADDITYLVDMESKGEEDRSKETKGIFEGDITQKKSQFESNINPKAKLLKASISRALAQTLRAQIGALPEVKPWSLLTAAMEVDSKGTGTGFGNRAGPKKMSENMTIAVRIRPPTKSEMKKKAARIVSTCTVTRPGSSSGRAEQRLVVLDPQMTDEIGVDQLSQALANDAHLTFPRNIASTFKFDHCYWSPLPGINMPKVNDKGHMFATQQDLYSSLGEGVVENALQGVSSTTFVYGPKSTGKSYSMFGDMDGGMKQDSSCLGLLPRVYAEIVEKVQASHSRDTTCQLSMLEIYNEKVVDLLVFTHKHYNHQERRKDHMKALKVREHPILGPYADGMRKVRVTTRAQVLSLVNEVLERRKADESWLPRRDYKARRTHATVLCTLEITPAVFKSPSRVDPYNPNDAHAIRVHMVDLPGAGASAESVDTWRTSVRTGSKASLVKPLKVADVGMSGTLLKHNRLQNETIKESACAPDANSNVNVLAEHEKKDSGAARKSQSHLNYILHCLERGFDMRSLPFRDSILTWLLRVALTAPNSKVTVLTSISPAEDAYDETLHVLKYAERLWSSRKMRRFGHLSPTRPQRSSTLTSNEGTTSMSTDVNDDMTVTSIRSGLLDASVNNSVSGTRFRAHNRTNGRTHLVKGSGRVLAEQEERPKWQKYLKQSPPRQAKEASARGRAPFQSQRASTGSLPTSLDSRWARSSSAGPVRGSNGFRSGMSMSMAGAPGSHRGDRSGARWGGDPELELELQSVRAERDAVLEKLDALQPAAALPTPDTPEGMITQLTARLSEQEAELATLRTLKASLDKGEAGGGTVESQVKALRTQVAQVNVTLAETHTVQQGDNELSWENQELRTQLGQALSTASQATEELSALQKQSQDEFASIWEAVQLLNATSSNKDAALAKLASEKRQLEGSLRKERERARDLDSEIEMLDKALLEAVGEEETGPGRVTGSNKGPLAAPGLAASADFENSAISAIPQDTTAIMAGSGVGGTSFSHHSVSSGTPFTPDPTARTRSHGATRGASTTGGKASARGGRGGVTRPFAKSSPAPSGRDAASPSSSSEQQQQQPSGAAVTGSVDETLKELGRFLVHDTAALSMQQASRQSRSGPK